MRITIATLLFLVATSANGAVRACNGARVSAGDCPGSGFTLFMFAIPTADLIEYADELAEMYGYPTILCTAADVAATPARCTAGQLGQQVTTPETKTAFANRMQAEEIRRRVHNRRRRLAAAAAETNAAQPGAIE